MSRWDNKSIMEELEELRQKHESDFALIMRLNRDLVVARDRILTLQQFLLLVGPHCGECNRPATWRSDRTVDGEVNLWEYEYACDDHKSALRLWQSYEVGLRVKAELEK